MTACLILLAHGSHDPDWCAPFIDLASGLGHDQVRLAFMEMATPTLATVAQALLTQYPDTQRLDVLPLFMAAGGHLRHDVPRLLQTLTEQYPHVTCTMLPPVGQHPKVVAAITQVCQDWLTP
jgi:sirohydrochlorin cobaltochelatase